MIILIPLGGIGSRFKKEDYKQPKALINVMGVPVIYWLLQNLTYTHQIDFIYIPYNKEYHKYGLEDRLVHDFAEYTFKFLQLDKNTEGAAETIHIALEKLNNVNDCPILCLDGDNFYNIDIVKIWNKQNQIFTFVDNNIEGAYSYVKINENNVVDIAEKQQISKLACTGAYGFKSFKKLNEMCKYVIANSIKQKNEFYTSGVIKEMIKNNVSVTVNIIDKNNWFCLGTPLQIKIFCNNTDAHKNIKIKKLRICFDLDNTLVTYQKIKNDYKTVEPIKKNIKYLQYLKSLGHTIIIYTARRMKTHGGNVGKIMNDVGKITFDTLDKFGITYDEIYFGKPYADFYIDDLAINSYDNINKQLGFYTDIIKPRHFNDITHYNMCVYKKEGEDLSGEIYFYKNMPFDIKNLFPNLINFDKNGKWYTMEKINGITASTLYLSKSLDENKLVYIMDSIKKIHSTKFTDNDINIYANYCDKLKKRYSMYDYSNFKNSDTIYNTLFNSLQEYENGGCGIIGVVHGDPVMTNIIIDDNEKIKFIDMRGNQNGKLTIVGDIMYDWAKLFQSLIGYDKILQNEYISETYEKNMINIFREYIIANFSADEYNNIKLITKSLLFSLIPLHDNNKCQKYFDLINCEYIA